MLFRLPPALLAVLTLTLSAIASPSSNASHLPLFSPSSHPLRTYHTSLSTLLPILPILSPPPSSTLAVTFATPSFRSMLYNWLCFLKYKAKWGEPIRKRWGEELVHDQTYKELIKVLVVTSDESLAKELSELGVVVWYLNGVDLGSDNGHLSDEELDLILRDDLFFNLRLLQLLIPPYKKEVGSDGEEKEDSRAKLIEWGTLHYQSLMLERSLVMSALVGALEDSQKMSEEEREDEEAEWQKQRDAHDYEKAPLFREAFGGVTGVLVVDNDAVWLSNPSTYLAHPYRPAGTHPSIIYSPDSSPDFENAFGTYSMPCACFFYSRVFDSIPPSPSSSSASATYPSNYSPAKLSSDLWRLVSLCHISMLLEALEQGRRQARMWGQEKESMEDFKGAIAPSFQATCLGPAIRMMEERPKEDGTSPVLPSLTHQEWLLALSSGDPEDLLSLLEELDLYTGGTGAEEPSSTKRNTCITHLVDSLSLPPTSPNPLLHTSLTSPTFHPIKSEALPYGVFPPGMSYFGGEDKEEGVRPCVVHANYALGETKMELLKGEGFWALGRGEGLGEEEGEWWCDKEVLDRA